MSSYFLSSILRCIAGSCVLSGWLALSTLSAQDTPEVPRQFTALDQTANETQLLILRSIRDRDPQSPIKIAKSAEALLDVGLYQDVRLLLNRLEGWNLDSEAMLTLTDEMGSSFFLQIFSHPNVQPEGHRVATAVLTGSSTAARSPARIQSLIATLASNDISARSLAARRLRRIGEPAMAEMINVFADESRSSEFPGIRAAIGIMAEDLPGPLLGAARADNVRIRTESIRLLTELDSDVALDLLTWIYLAPQHPPSLKELAHEGLVKRGVDADPEKIEQYLFERAFAHLRGKGQMPGTAGSEATIWGWDPNQSRMVSSTVDRDTALRILAARHAVWLYEINPESKKHRAIFLLTQLEAVKRLAGAGQTVNVDDLKTRLKTNPREMDMMLAQAIRLKLYPAATACCEYLKKTADETFLHRADGQPSPLIEAITSGDRHLQFAAFDAIGAINPQRAYVGSSHVISLAVFLANSQGAPIALAGHRQADVAQTFAAMIDSSEVVGQSASNSRQLFDDLTSNPDVEMVMISDTLDQPGFNDLIQQIRADWRTRQLPIALLYTDVDRGHQAGKLFDSDSRFIAIPFTLDSQLIDQNVQRLHERVGAFRVTRPQRLLHASAAMNWLVGIASDRKAFRFYDLGNYQDGLTNLIYRPGFEGPASRILASIGTPDAQRHLVDFASQPGFTDAQRQQAVEAFQQAVAQCGTMLTTVEIKRQYDRYNNSESQSEGSQKILGQILDVIESAE